MQKSQSLVAPAEPESRVTFEDVIAGLALAIIVISVAWGVITRYLLAQPASWAVEAAAIAFAWMVFVGAAAAFARNEHIAIDLVVNLLPGRIQQLARLLADGIVLVILLAVTYLATRFSIATMDAPTTILRLPQSVIYSGAALGFLLMSVRHSVQAWKRFRQGAAS
ncbi:TRAP transporter small permease [Paracandidimonas soli]|uniref:TRAP transporter small permease n=1 Tax=Paracandidimonas soli TaxID=1917182 RepID=UPI00333E88CC